jgi:phage shock protein PspC (stress-responsive transcriptional regulator)
MSSSLFVECGQLRPQFLIYLIRWIIVPPE